MTMEAPERNSAAGGMLVAAYSTRSTTFLTVRTWAAARARTFGVGSGSAAAFESLEMAGHLAGDLRRADPAHRQVEIALAPSGEAVVGRIQALRKADCLP
ncbi:hypothetical protein [Nonomuraea sp. NPDC049141]|uniref:hypothetical protein n=1 Tax=unclassified Nonomuraea TaxID=2593643 RepID=UPI0033D41B8C